MRILREKDITADPFNFHSHKIVEEKPNYYFDHRIVYNLDLPNGQQISRDFCDDSDVYNITETLDDLEHWFNDIVSKLTAHGKMEWIANFTKGAAQ
tara:strand:- start:21 stop:308 length:288 start_codon:yes stop_codon:yes gene_type:complete